MRTVEITKHLDNNDIYGTFSTTIGGQLVEGGYDNRDEQLELFCFSVNGEHSPGYMISTRLYNYLHSIVSEEV